MKNKSRAFSLIELSIVILIIGILIAGVTQSSRLVRQAKLQTAQTLTKSSPVAGISGLVLWLEPTLDGSFLNYIFTGSYFSLIQEAFALTPNPNIDEGSAINQWNDINPQSSSKYFLNAVLGQNAPIYKDSAGPNGLPSLYSENVVQMCVSSTTYNNDTSCASIIPNNNNFTYFVVAMPKDSSSSMVVYASGNHQWEYYLGDEESLARSFCFDGDCVGDTVNQASALSPEVTSLVVNTQAGSTGFSLYVDGAIHVNNGDLPSDNDAPATFGTDNQNMYISEIIAFDRALKNEERQSVEEYLGKKYGIKVVKSTTADL